MTDTIKNTQTISLYLLMLLSGFAGLGYEIVWSRMLSVALGHEIVAILAVIAAFFSGLALGAFSLDSLIRRSQVPGRWYAAMEVIIGLWAILLIFLIPEFNQVIAKLIGSEPTTFGHWATAFVGTFILLMPATVAMGATLPAMERLFSRLQRNGWSVGGLYAANTFGAMAGTMLTTLLLAPLLGFASTLLALALINFSCAIAVLLGSSRGETDRLPIKLTINHLPATWYLVLIIFFTGLLGIAYEVLVIRVMSQVLENTIYTFASLLAIYLFGTALGAAFYQRFAPRDNFNHVLSKLLVAMSVACLLGVGLLWTIEPVNLYLVDWLGNGTFSAISGELIIGLLVFLLPTIVMGATFSHLAQGARDSLGFGRALGINTFGAALAPLIFGVILLPLLGSKTSLLLICLAYLILIPRKNLSRYWIPSSVTILVAGILLLIPAQLRFLPAPSAGKVIAYQEGVMASVAVVQDKNEINYLRVNSHYTMGSSASGFSDRRQAHIPLLLHPSPKDALFLGLGTGSTFVTSAVYPELNATAVELVPEVLPLIGYFGPSLEDIQNHDRLTLKAADARRYVNATPEQYDVIIAEVFHPSRDGAGSLYTKEHFQAIRKRLREQGLFCQWLPLFQLDIPTLKTIIRSFVSVFPDSQAYLAHFSLGQPLIGLVGYLQPTSYTQGWLANRVNYRELAEELIELRLDSDFAFFGGFLASSQELLRFSGEGPLNTDNHPVVTFQAPEFVYAGPEPAWKRLLALIAELQTKPEDLLSVTQIDNNKQFSQRLKAYWDARNAYLQAGVGVKASNDTQAMLTQIGKPLLSIVHMSNDFSPAYQPLLQMAFELYETDPTTAKILLEELEAANPRRYEANRLRLRLFGG